MSEGIREEDIKYFVFWTSYDSEDGLEEFDTLEEARIKYAELDERSFTTVYDIIKGQRVEK